MASVGAGAQQPPKQYADVAVAGCGHVGELIAEGSGTGTKGSVTTRYATASFELVCENAHVGQLDIQTADNELAIVSYRYEKGSADALSTRGPEVRPLVEDAIRNVCSCAAR